MDAAYFSTGLTTGTYFLFTTASAAVTLARAMCQRFIYEYAKLLDVEIPKKSERGKERRKVFCPYCGKELHKVEEGLTKEEIDEASMLLVFDRGGGFGE